jgi:hypothetical protein
MELEHAVQQPGFLAAIQLMVLSVLAPGVMAGSGIYQKFVKVAASYVVSFGPLAILIYVLYRVSRLA